MEWIEFSVDNVNTIPAPREAVWPYLVDPARWRLTRPGMVTAVTADGVPGTEGHVVFFEHESPACGTGLHKTKVLKAEAPGIWATLTEQAGWSGREYYVLNAAHGGLWTEIHLHGMYREGSMELDERKRRDYRAARIAQVTAAESEAADYFANAVIASLDA